MSPIIRTDVQRPGERCQRDAERHHASGNPGGKSRSRHQAANVRLQCDTAPEQRQAGCLEVDPVEMKRVRRASRQVGVQREDRQAGQAICQRRGDARVPKKWRLPSP